jgi:hypothetical protein
MVEVRSEDPIRIPPLVWPQDALGSFSMSYDKQRDILFAYLVPKQPAVSFDVGGHFASRFNPETGDVVGIEFEDFPKVFLFKCPELRPEWDNIKSTITKRSRKYNHADEYLQFLLEWAKRTLKAHPSQLALDHP